MASNPTPHRTPGTGRPRGRPRGSRTRHSFATPGSLQRVRSGTSSTHRPSRSSRPQPAQSDPSTYKPREERNYKEFHPDFDIEFQVKSYDSREIDGHPLPIGTSVTSPGKVNGIHIRVEEVLDLSRESTTPKPSADSAPEAIETEAAAGLSVGPESPSKQQDSIKDDDESRVSSPHDIIDPIPSLITNTPTRRSSRQKDNKEKEKEKASFTPKSNSVRPLLPLSNIHHNERLSLPVPSYKAIVPFQLAETYVDRAMASVGFQESDYWQRPNTMVRNIGIRDDVKEGEARISSLIEESEAGSNISHTITPGTVEYDMDEQDDKWLAQLNAVRKSHEVPMITREIFEITITKIEREWYALEKMIPKQSDRAAHVKKGNDDDEEDTSEDSKCQICDDGECENSNAIVFCDGCDIAVHQDCYGVPFIPEGQWLCRKCSLLSPRREVNCIFCPNTEGAFKMTDSALWSHLLCAIWIPEVTISNMVYMEPVEGVELVPKSRWKLYCYICKQRMGACIQCSNKSCYQAFHVTCARKAKLFISMRQQVPTDPSGATAVGTERSLIFDGSQLKAFCDKHVPTEWRKEYRTDIHIKTVQRHFERMFYDKEWGDSQMKALAGPSAFNNNNTTSTGPKITLNVGNSKRKRSSGGGGAAAGNKVIWRLPSGAPIIPNILYTTVLEAISRFSIRKPKEYVAEICKYWSLKREARRDASLLKRLQAASSNFTSDEVTKKDYSSMVDGEEKLKRRLDFAIKLRHDLERLRLLVDDIKKREKEKLKQAECLKEMVDTVYFPIIGIVKPILDRAQQLDSKDFFKTEFGNIKQKIHDREYNTVSHFSRDILSVLTSSVTSRSKFAVATPIENTDFPFSFTGTGLASSAVTPAATNIANPFDTAAQIQATSPVVPRQSKAVGDTAGKTAGRILRIIQPLIETAKLQELAMREDPNERMAGEVDERYQEIVIERKKREELEAKLALSKPSETLAIGAEGIDMDRMDIDNPVTESELEVSDRAVEAALESATATLSQSQHTEVDTDGIIGIPWYTKPFSPLGATLLSEERWMGMDVVRDMSPLSELDEDEVERLQRTATPEVVSPLTEMDDGDETNNPMAGKYNNKSNGGIPSTPGTRISMRTTKGPKRVSYIDTQNTQRDQEIIENSKHDTGRETPNRDAASQPAATDGIGHQTKQLANKSQRRGRGYVWVEVDDNEQKQGKQENREEGTKVEKDPDAMDIDSEPPIGAGQNLVENAASAGIADTAESIDSPLTSLPDDELELDPDDHLSLDSQDINALDRSGDNKEVTTSINGDSGSNLLQMNEDNLDSEKQDNEFHTPVETLAHPAQPLSIDTMAEEAGDSEATHQLSVEESIAAAAATAGAAAEVSSQGTDSQEQNASKSSPLKRSTRTSPRQKDATTPSDDTKPGGELLVNGNVKMTPKGGSVQTPVPMTTRSRRVVDVDTTPTKRGSNRSSGGKKK